MFISSCSQEDSNPMFETNSETHINNLESKALPSVKIFSRGGENQNHPIDIPVLNQR